jgi:acid phosphatase family membrane protein YuiD
MHVAVGELFRNPTFWSGIGAWFTASFVKILINLRRTGHVDFQYLVSLGGMPSAHSAMASGIALSVGLQTGFGSQIFVLALAFAVVVMFDASTVRRATGQQARLLNQIVEELFKHHHLSQSRLKELLGHTRLEVYIGMLVGFCVAVLVNLLAERL